jgi:hypothetical protein
MCDSLWSSAQPLSFPDIINFQEVYKMSHMLFSQSEHGNNSWTFDEIHISNCGSMRILLVHV